MKKLPLNQHVSWVREHPTPGLVVIPCKARHKTLDLAFPLHAEHNSMVRWSFRGRCRGVSSLNSEPGGPGFDIFALWLFRPTPQDSFSKFSFLNEKSKTSRRINRGCWFYKRVSRLCGAVYAENWTHLWTQGTLRSGPSNWLTNTRMIQTELH